MLKQVFRTAVVLAGAASMFLGAACATADTQQGSMDSRDASHRVAARQIEAGQSRYMIPGEALVPAGERAPYALTGHDRSDSDRGMRAFTGPTGRWVQTGQTRTWIPPTP